MSISGKSTYNGRDLTLVWYESNQIPTGKKISQVSAFCVDNNGDVLIVRHEKQGWCLPGGHPEDGETVEETLRREVQEEADATIKSDINLMGYLGVFDPDNNSIEGRDYFQLRFLCKLDELNDFKADFETSDRQFIKPEELPKYITWMKTSNTGWGFCL